ncbi:MAG TPA: hypothetical protein VF017_03675 [Thermoanaerobaculia bacterium]|nr:hypothetical protein [Thermoanaerobaculia bacterium]
MLPGQAGRRLGLDLVMTGSALLEISAEVDDPLLKRWRGVVDDLRSGHFSITPSLAALTLVSESAERAVIFLAHDDHLVALGAFGFAAPSGLGLALATRRLVLPTAAAPCFRSVLHEGRMRLTHFDSGDLPPVLAARIGRPRRPEGVLLPVPGGDGVLAVIYADNGALATPIAAPETLEKALTEVGRVFEGAEPPGP